MGAAAKTVVQTATLDMPPEGYELRVASIDQNLATRYFRASSALAGLGVPGVAHSAEEAANIQAEHSAAMKAVQGLVAAEGGESVMPWRIRYSDHQIDYLAKKGDI